MLRRLSLGALARHARSAGAPPRLEVLEGRDLPSLTFGPPANYAVGGTPYSVAVADFNHDGKLDLVTANETSNTVSVLLGNGDGTFRPAQSFPLPAGSAPVYVAVGDFNRDGNPDIVVADNGNDSGNSVSVLLGNGDGTFQAPRTYGVGQAPVGIAVADFNGDGRLDLAVANQLTNNVSVLLGNGDGTFRPPVNYPAGSLAREVAAGDLNGDGKIDLVVANQGANTVSVLLGNGDGTFRPGGTFATGPDPTSIALADLRGNGTLDVVTANFTFGGSTGTVSVLLGNGNGTFQPRQDYTVGANPHNVEVADVDLDGHADIVVTDRGGASVSVLLGNGDGTFQAHQDFATGAGPFSVAVGDFTGDGLPDLATADGDAGTASVLLNQTLPSSLAAVAGGGQHAAVNTAFAAPLRAQLMQGGAPFRVSGIRVTFTAPAGGPTGTFAGAAAVTATTDANGVATAPPFTAGHLAGGYAVTATTEGVAAAASFSLTNDPGAPAAVAAAAGDGQSATVNTAFAVPLRAAVRDQFGNAVPGVVVSFAAPGAGAGGTFAGGLATATATTDAAGVAVAPAFTANTTAGRYTVTAAVTGAAPAPFNLANTAGAAATVAAVSGGGQSALLNTAFAAPLVARVTDAFANPVPGAAVTFAGPAGGAGASFTPGPTAATDAAGLAEVSAAANGATGAYVVTAAAAGVAAPASFALTNTAAPVKATLGVFDPNSATWYLRRSLSAGPPDAGPFSFGPVGSVPVSGDWGGSGPDPIGVFDPNTFTWYLRNEVSAGPPDAGQFQYGGPGWQPVTGDWNGSGHTGIGAYDPSTATWYLRNEASAGAPDAGQFRFGVAGGVPVVGDWAGTGHLGIGVFDPSTGTWYLRSSPSAGPPDAGTFQYGGLGWRPVAGDWAGAGHAGIGAFDPATGTWYLRGEASAGAPDAGQFAYGGTGWLPVVGALPPAQLLLAAGGEGAGAGPLGAGQLQSAVAGALARLSAAGVDAGLLGSLGSAGFGVADLPPGVLGEADARARRVVLSADGAGHGWFVDTTPLQDEEFAAGAPGSPLVALPGSPAAGKEDLLTAVLHEMGHLAGRPDGGTGLMAAALGPGTRDLGALDQVFAGGAPGLTL
jgi:hypothetical protein